MTQLATTPTIYKYVAPVRLDTSRMPLLDQATLPSTVLMKTLARALMCKRDSGSATEASFVAWLARQLPVTLIDEAGNVHVDQRGLPEHRSMFTSHTDTCHVGGGVNPVHVDGKFWRASKGECLGADDGAGIALMCHMIDAGVPGYFVFFRAEECGGIGSKWLADNMPEVFKDIDRAVAFDRAGYHDVITHQAGGRCCSDEFARSLSEQLTTEDMSIAFMPDNGGVYTDTAEFIGLVPECTNVSVGYLAQHGDREEQDVEFLQALGQRLVLVHWDSLPTKRDPKAREPRYGRSYADMGTYPASMTTTWDDTDDAFAMDMSDYGGVPIGSLEEELFEAIDDAMYGDYTWLIDLIAECVYPEDVSAARRLISKARLTETLLSAAQEAVYGGAAADHIMLDMFDKCQLA